MADAATSDGSPAGSSYELMREQLLDEHNVEYAILTGFFYPTEMRVQPEFATALAAAYNDWLLENWLAKDERFRGCVCVVAQEPEAAAREIDRVGAHPRVVQVMLPAIPHDVLGRSFYHPIFEAAVRNNLTIAFHQGSSTATAVGLHRVAYYDLPKLAVSARRADSSWRLRQVSGPQSSAARIRMDLGAGPNVALRS